MTPAQTEQFTKKIGSIENSTQFITQTGISSKLTQIAFTVSSIIIGLTLVIFTVEGVGISTAVGKSLHFIKDNLTFTLAYFLWLTFIGFLHTLTTPLVLKDISGAPQLLSLPVFLMNIPYTFLNLVLEATTIIYYLRNRKISHR